LEFNADINNISALTWYYALYSDKMTKTDPLKNTYNGL